MENTRYTFSGFSFAKGQYFNLQINIRNHAGYGTNHSVEMGLELTESERLELISILINAGKKETE